MTKSLRTFAGLAAATLLSAVPLQAQTQSDAERIEPNRDALAAIAAGDVYRPVSEWEAGVSDPGCWVRREFAKGDQAIGFVLRRLQPGVPVQHVITGSGITIRGGAVEAGFAPGTGLNTIDRYNMSVFPEHDVIVMAHRPFAYTEGRSEEGFAGQTEHYVLQGGRSEPIVIATGAIDDALATLAECAMPQLVSYGVAPADRGNYLRYPSLTNPDQIGSFLTSGYARVSRRHGYRGPVQLRLVIDAEGNLARCDVTTPFIVQVLRELACDTMRERGEFLPALAADGTPVTDFYMQTVRFVIPPQPNADGSDPRRL